MRHSAAHRAALALAALLLAAALLFAWSQASPAAAPRAAAAGGRPAATGDPFAVHCAGCHALEDLTEPFAGPGAAEAVLELLELLEDHGGSSPQEDRQIAARLLEAARGE